MNTNLKRDVVDLENVLFVCFGQPDDDDLPQIANDDGALIDVMQEYTGKPFHLVEAEFYHQMEH